MTPAEYMTEIVVPTLREFRDERKSRRRAYLACIAVFHVNDHLKQAGETGTETAMRGACGDAFDVVRAVCNGTKHLVVNASHPIPFKAGDDTYRPPAVLGEMVLSVSVLGDSKGGREIGSGQKRFDLYDCAKAVALAYQTLYPAQLGACDLTDC